MTDMTDDELLNEITQAAKAVEEAERHLDQLLMEGQGRKTIKNPQVAAAAGVHERTLYKWLRRAWDRTHPKG